MASFLSTQTPTDHEEEMKSLDEETDTVVCFQEPSSSAGTLGRTFRPHTTVKSRLVRPSLVCRECRRLTLKCSRRGICDECNERKQDCKSDSGALPKVDVQSLHNTQMRHQSLLETITNFLGIPQEEVQMIMDAPTYPPHPDFAGPTVDVKRVKAVLGIDHSSSRESIPRSKLGITPSTGSNALLPPAIVTFSRPPPQISNPSANIFDFSTTARPNQIPSVMVDLATRVFQANSIVVSHHVLAQLQVWQRVLGWEPRPANEGSIPAAYNKPVTGVSVGGADGGDGERHETGSSSRAKPKNAGRNAVLVTAPPSEIEYYDQPRPKNLSVLALAHEVFIMPAFTGPRQAVSPHVPDSFSALGLSSSSGSTSSSHPHSSSGFGMPLPHNFPALSLGSSSASTSSSQPPSSPELGLPPVACPSFSISSSPSILPLITPQAILSYLPAQTWTRAFIREFDTLMINHDGIGASGEHSILKKRIELMVEWAYDSTKRLGSTGGEPGQDSDSKCSSPSSPSSAHSQRSGSIPRGTGEEGTAQEESKPFSPPPTLSLFAVACAVYALGALSYGSKLIHGRFLEDGENTPELSATAPDAPLNPHMHPLPDKAMPSNLLNLARAALLVHDESDLPPSLDYLHAHMLTWLYLLHPSDSASSVASSGFQGSSTGVGSGGITAVEQTIYKELGKCVSVARAMGLDLVDRSSGRPWGGVFGLGRVKGPEDQEEGMGIWEKEMRRRVWWQLMMFDQQISENLGRPPHIPPGTYACKPPSGTDESMFGPTATRIPKPREGANGSNTTYFATKCQLLTIIKTLPYAQLEEGATLDLAKQLEARVFNWRSALPAQYKIDFREKPEETLFPGLDTIDVQACDLHIMANVFLLRLWLPFFNDALSGSSQSNQGVLHTAITAANAVMVASHHLVTRFRAARPMSFGHYDFGNSVWFATGILASVATMKSDGVFSSPARRGVEIAGALFRDQVVEGKSDSNHAPKYEVNKIMDHIERLVAQVLKGKRSSGSNRMSVADLGEMPCSVPIPYVGTAAIATATEINVSQAQDDPPLESGLREWRNLPDQDSDETSSDSVLLTPLFPGMSLDLASDSESRMDEDSIAASAFAAEVSGSRTSGLASRTGGSQTSISQRKIRPVIGIRRRLPLAAFPTSSKSPVHAPPNSRPSRARAPASEVSSSSSSEPVAYVIPPPSNQPSTMHPTLIHQSSPLNPRPYQDRLSQNGQHWHSSSPTITIGNCHPPREFSQIPPNASPGIYQDPLSQGHRAPTSTPYPDYVQVQSHPSGAVMEIDSRLRLPLSQSLSFGSPVSALPQTTFTLPVGHLQDDAYLTDLQAIGGPPEPRQPGPYGLPAGGSHLRAQDNLGGFDIWTVLPISANKPFNMQTEGLSHLPPVIHEGQQYESHPDIYRPQHNTVDSFPEVTWGNIPDP